MTAYAVELAAATEFAALGARVALGHFRRDPELTRKDDGTWMTEADWAAEAQIRLRIARTFPEHNVLGEEAGLTAAGGGPPHPSAPTWVVDPIDGTNNYIAGIPIWATLVGLRIDDRSVVGVCHAPALGETYEASSGGGARCNGDPIAVDSVSDLADATVLYADAGSWDGPFFAELVARCSRSRGFGDFWGHMLVARGAAHVMVERRLSIWDVCALQPIVEEAGGRLTQLDGSDWVDGASCLTTNAVLHDDIVRLATGGGQDQG